MVTSRLREDEEIRRQEDKKTGRLGDKKTGRCREIEKTCKTIGRKNGCKLAFNFILIFRFFVILK